MVVKVRKAIQSIDKVLSALDTLDVLRADVDGALASIEALERTYINLDARFNRKLDKLQAEFSLSQEKAKADLLDKVRVEQRDVEARIQDGLIKLAEGTGKLKLMTDNPRLFIGSEGQRKDV